jgi:hypothetical protein
MGLGVSCTVLYATGPGRLFICGIIRILPPSPYPSCTAGDAVAQRRISYHARYFLTVPYHIKPLIRLRSLSK